MCIIYIYIIIYTHTCKCGGRRIATEPRNTDKNQESLNILADVLLFSPRNRETKLLGVSCWCCHCWDLLRSLLSITLCGQGVANMPMSRYISMCLDISRCVSMCLDVSQYQCKSRTLKQPAAQFSRSLNCENEFPSRRLDTSWHVQMPWNIWKLERWQIHNA